MPVASHLPAEVARDSLMHNYRSYSRSLENVIVRHRLDPALRRLTDRHVMFLHGDADQTAPLPNVQTLEQRHRGWSLRVVTGAGHHLPILRPELLASLLSETLAPAPVKPDALARPPDVPGGSSSTGVR